MKDNETFTFENREYINPVVSRDEQLGFIDNLRQTRDENINRINTDTYNLGTPVPSIRGGLGGSGATFESRYVTPYVNNMVQNLKTAAQETALSTALSNLQAQYKNRYTQAYRAAKERERNKQTSNPDSPDVPLTTEDDTRKATSYITNDIPGTIASSPDGSGIVWQSLDDGTVVKRENLSDYNSFYAGSPDSFTGAPAHKWVSAKKGRTVDDVLNIYHKLKDLNNKGHKYRVFYRNGVAIGYGEDAQHIQPLEGLLNAG